jgi:hypothetical protein
LVRLQNLIIHTIFGFALYYSHQASMLIGDEAHRGAA